MKFGGGGGGGRRNKEKKKELLAFSSRWVNFKGERETKNKKS